MSHSQSQLSVESVLANETTPPTAAFNGHSEPYTRWWWLQGPFRRKDIEYQLAWLKAHGFGGVEVAWIRPVWYSHGDGDPGVEWLGPEWSDLAAFTKRAATKLGLGCDFTFGSSWPFGGSCVMKENALQDFDGATRQRLSATWEDWRAPYVLDHLSRDAIREYARAMMPAFKPALDGPPSALFCDSLELDTHSMWNPQLWERFRKRLGYELRLYASALDDYPDVRYDYRKLISEAICSEFFEPFTEACHENNALSRVQCHGAPADLLAAYATVDIPESESLLFNPHFSRIPASAAALSDKPVVSAETFTCLYGFPGRQPEAALFWKAEQIADMKLLADAIFANGVNQIVWHGMPYNPPGGAHEFYAFVHVGPDAHFAGELSAFNKYLADVSSIMKLGRTYSQLAVYLPNEDNWMLDEIPRAQRTPGANYMWEMRHVAPPAGTEHFHPLWITLPFLKRAEMVGGVMRAGPLEFQALLLDCRWLDAETVDELLRLAAAGLPIAIQGRPQQPGLKQSDDYSTRIDELLAHSNVVIDLAELPLKPLVSGAQLPLYWARETEDAIYIFIAQPAARAVKYPMQYCQSQASAPAHQSVTIRWRGIEQTCELNFEKHQSLLLRISRDGSTSLIDIAYNPPEPAAAEARNND